MYKVMNLCYNWKCKPTKEELSMEKLFTVKSLAEYLDLSILTVREMLRDGKIRGSKIGKEWRVTESAVRDFLKAHEVTDTPH